MKVGFLVLLMLGVNFLASNQPAQNSVPAITAAFANEVTVDGTADSNAGPVTLFDTSYEVQTKLGTGEVLQDGKFGIVVKPALVAGHLLVAVDAHGQRSALFTVRPARSKPAATFGF